jgi:hypothetical protein
MPSSVVGAVAGGLVNKAFGSKASGSMQQGADQASKVQKYIYDTTRKDLEPYRTSGYAANNKLSQLMGLDTFDRAAIESQLRAANPGKYAANNSAPTGQVGQAPIPPSMFGVEGGSRGRLSQDAFERDYNTYRDQVKYQGQPFLTKDEILGLSGSEQAAYQNVDGKYYRTDGQSGSPSSAGPNLSSLLQGDIDAEIARLKGEDSYGSLASKFSLDDYEADPGYQFRLDEGNKALERSQAAKGGLLSGAAMKEALRYGQGMGSQEYGNSYNRFMDQNNTLYNRYSGISNQGMGAVNSGSQSGQNYANNMSGIYGNIANANAASAINQGNNLSQSLGSLFGGSQYGNIGQTPPIIPGGSYGGGYGNYGSAGRIDWFR